MRRTFAVSNAYKDGYDDGIRAGKLTCRIELDQLDALAARLAEAERLLSLNREDYCWLGNTGKNLSCDTYAAMVDRIDAFLDGTADSASATRE